MNPKAKITLSKQEWETINNTEFFEHKRKVTEKLFHALSGIVQTSNHLQIFHSVSFPEGTDYTTGKITKGENYLGLPYVILDFPRKFTPADVFAVRTMIWWGQFISCTLQLDGTSANKYRSTIAKQYPVLKKSELYICIHESAWHHHFEKDNFRKIKKLTRTEFEKALTANAFIKMAAKLPIKQVEKMEAFAVKNYSLFASALNGA